MICLQGIPAFLIALAYLFIPATVSYFGYRRRGLALNWMFLCCGIFILACGATYATEVWTLWHATYWLSGAITAITAMAALPTAVLLVRLVPGALALPTPEAMRPEFADHGRVEQSLSKASSDLNCVFNGRQKSSRKRMTACFPRCYVEARNAFACWWKRSRITRSSWLIRRASSLVGTAGQNK